MGRPGFSGHSTRSPRRRPPCFRRRRSRPPRPRPPHVRPEPPAPHPAGLPVHRYILLAFALSGALAGTAGGLFAYVQSVVSPESFTVSASILILTIAGERLEMSRLLPSKAGSEGLFLVSIGLLAAGARNSLTDEDGAVLFGLGLLAVMLWLFRHDIARHTIRQQGQTRFFAVCMLLGYVWLGFAGVALLARFPFLTAQGYDIALHAVLIGFVISMVFGHALVILPAVTHWRVAYTHWLYLPLALLHLSVLLRAAGGLAVWAGLRQLSGLITIAAILAFVLTMAGSAWRHRLRRAAQQNGNQAALLPSGSALPRARS